MRRALIPALSLLAACDKASNGLITAYQDGDELVVDLQDAPELFVKTCTTPVLQLAQITADGGRTPLVTAAEDIVNRYDGYWLDGRFVYPATDEGCDILMCTPLDDSPRLQLIAYTVTGDEAPPDDLEAWIAQHGGRLEAAEAVPVVESMTISGAVEVTLSAFDNDTCSGVLQTLTTTADIE